MRQAVGVRAGLVAAVSLIFMLSGCDQRPIAGPQVFEPSEAALHEIGRFDSAKKTLVANAGERGMLAYGPYAELAPGRYEATFVVSSGNASTPIGHVDINAFTPAKQGDVLATLPIRPNLSKDPLKLSFDVPPGVKLELRVFCEGTASVELHRTQIKKL